MLCFLLAIALLFLGAFLSRHFWSLFPLSLSIAAASFLFYLFFQKDNKETIALLTRDVVALNAKLKEQKDQFDEKERKYKERIGMLREQKTLSSGRSTAEDVTTTGFSFHPIDDNTLSVKGAGDLTEWENRLKQREQDLSEQERKLKELMSFSCAEQYQSAVAFYTNIRHNNPFFQPKDVEKFKAAFQSARLDRALAHYLSVPTQVEIKAKMPSHTKPSHTEEEGGYVTSLTSCTCNDSKKRNVVCKHMISLALYFNAVYSMGRDLDVLVNTLVQERNTLQTLRMAESDKQRKSKGKGN